jgi:STE24 endopeptidase
VRDSIVSLARANQIPSDNIYWFDASKQSKRISANVSGALGTMRISLNDNLLTRTSLPEMRAVMAHEMGHYVLNHVWRFVIYHFVLFLGVFYLLHRLYDNFLARRSAALGLRDRGDVAGLPAVIAIGSVIMLLLTPVTNAITRQAESEADMFGLNAAREAQGFASVAMQLSTYRKISPAPLEEILFYDHPSGRTRITMAMQWLKENPPAQAPSPTMQP